MKKTLLSFVAFFAVALFATAQVNLIENGDFEKWTDGKPDNWTTASTAGNAMLSQSKDAHSGENAVNVASASSNKRIGYKEITLKAGDYTVKFWAKGGKARPGYTPVDESNKVTGSYVYPDENVTLSATEWTEVSCSFTLAATTRLSLVVMNPKNSGELFIDDYSLTTENGGLEDGGSTVDPTPDPDPDPTPDPTVPDYTTIAELKADATETATSITYTFSDLLVTGVGKSGNNYSVYVTDGTEGMLLYGPNVPNVKKGDKISGQLAGQLQLFRTLTEIGAADYSKVTVSSSDNEVQPVAATLAGLKANTDKTFENLYVRFEGVSFTTDALSSRNIVMTDDEGTEVTLRDNFNVLADYIFATGEKYNVNGYVAYYNGTAQIYPMSADEVELITTLTNPETAWQSAAVAQEPGKTFEPNVLTTLSDGEKTFTSSNEQVATVDAEGNVTFTGYGKTTITVATAATATYLASQASYELYNIKGEGTLENPYIASDLGYYNGTVKELVWVKGTILGCYANGGQLAAEAVASNLAVGADDFFVPVQLPYASEGFSVRADLNLVDHADNKGKEVYLLGNIDTYFSTAGIKNTAAYSWDGLTVTAIDAPIMDAGKVNSIYDLSGRRADKAVRGLYIINGKKVIVK